MQEPILTVGVSVRALFNTEDSHRIFLDQGQAAFDAYMISKEKKPLRPGVAFNLVKKLLALNAPEQKLVDVILLSRSSTGASVRVVSSLKHHGLDIHKLVLTSGGDRFKYAQLMGLHLFLSAEGMDVAKALELGVAAATLIPSAPHVAEAPGEIVRVAFDGDSVLFSDEAERVYQSEGLEAFQASEQRHARSPLKEGPFKPVLQALSALQDAAPGRVETALVTARGAQAAERVLYTLRGWKLGVDTMIFAEGRPKGPLLKAFETDIFFDDARKHIDSAAEHVAAGHVPHGVNNPQPVAA